MVAMFGQAHGGMCITCLAERLAFRKHSTNTSCVMTVIVSAQQQALTENVSQMITTTTLKGS